MPHLIYLLSDRCDLQCSHVAALLKFTCKPCAYVISTDCDIRLLDIDDFIADLWKVHLAVKAEGFVQV